MEKGSKLIIWSLILATLGSILLLFSLITPWWTATTVVIEKDKAGEPDGYDCQTDMVFIGGYTISGDSAYSQERWTSIVTCLITYGAITAFVLSLVMASLILFIATGRCVNKYFFTIFSIFVIFLSAVTPVMFSVFLPIATEHDHNLMVNAASGDDTKDTPYNSFFGTSNDTVKLKSHTKSTEVNWGPDIGFFLSVMATISFLSSFIIYYRWRKHNNGT